MRQDVYIQDILCDSPGTDDRLDVSFDDLGITPAVASGLKPVITAKRDSSGDPVTLDESAEIDLDNERLTISEGSTGFSDGDIYTVLLITPRGQVAGTSRAS